MKENRYILSVKASEDIREIAKFTIDNFGIRQADIYRNELASCINQLGETPEIGREYIAIKNKMLLRHRFKAHTVFYYAEETKIIIVRVLGNRMNFSKHLKK